jgi:hypothetical protein
MEATDFDSYHDIASGAFDPGAELQQIWKDIKALDLIENVAELEAFGYTVVPPAKVAPPEFSARLRQSVLDVHERRTGHKVDLNSGSNGLDMPLSMSWNLLPEGRVFEEMLLNPTVCAMARYACGANVVLSELNGSIKNQDARRTHSLHIDTVGTPPPMPSYAQVLNVTWALTDYSRDLGATSIVPCSHRFGRMPLPYEADFLSNNAPVTAVPIDAKAGSLVIWHGAAWHGAYPRSAPGVRVNAWAVFTRSYMRPIRDFRRECPPEILARNPPEFAQLLGMDALYPTDPGRQLSAKAMMQAVNAGQGQWA